MTSFVDHTRAPRSGEALDVQEVGDYLRAHVPELAEAGPLVVEQFPLGHSNLTYLLRIGETELVLRRPPFGAKRIKAGHDMGREFKILSCLHRVYAPAPRPYVYCEDESVMGCPFYVMERKKGIILRKDLPQGMTIDPATMERLCTSLVDNLVAIHDIDYAAVGLGDLGRPEGFITRQVNGWADRYEKSQTDDLPEVEPVVRWCREHIPVSPPPTLIHNDYKYDNVVLDPEDVTRIIGVLDWEMSTVGDPLLDLGVTLSYWIQRDDPQDLQLARFGVTHLDGNLTREQILSRYAEKTGRDISNIHFYFAFALFKLAVVAQQIYYRYAKGFTQDERFALMIEGVKILLKYTTRVIETGRVDF